MDRICQQLDICDRDDNKRQVALQYANTSSQVNRYVDYQRKTDKRAPETVSGTVKTSITGLRTIHPSSIE